MITKKSRHFCRDFSIKEFYILATPVSFATFATASATVVPTRLSKALGIIYVGESSSSLTREAMANMKTLLGRAAQPQEIIDLCLFVASEKGQFINGENICVDGGMTKQMIYHNDYDWILKK